MIALATRGGAVVFDLRILGGEQMSGDRRRQRWFSSIGEEIGGLGLAPVWTMRATAAECLLPFSSQAIRKHLRDRGAGAGVAPEFVLKQNSALVGATAEWSTTRRVPRLARSTSIEDRRETPELSTKGSVTAARVVVVSSVKALVLACDDQDDGGLALIR